MTIAILLATLGVVALGYDLWRLAAHNWPYIVVALGLLAAVFAWALLPGRKARTGVPDPGAAAPPVVSDPGDQPRPDDLVS